MRNRFDYVIKEIGEKALGPCGTTVTQEAINPETQYADLRHEPDPARQGERDRLGLLGRLAACACILEVYSEAPDASQFRACLTKHLAAWRQRVRNARSDSKKRNRPPPSEDSMASFLWIIAAGSPTTLLTKLRLERSPRWSAGIYLFGDDVLRVGIVVASELPRDRTTLLVRLMAAGPLLALAVREVAALPPDAYERVVAEPVLLLIWPICPRRTYAFEALKFRTSRRSRSMRLSKAREAGRDEGPWLRNQRARWSSSSSGSVAGAWLGIGGGGSRYLVAS